MPLLYRYILDEYGLRGGLILTCGVVLNSVVAGALLRPTTFYTGGKSNSNKSTVKQIQQKKRFKTRTLEDETHNVCRIIDDVITDINETDTHSMGVQSGSDDPEIIIHNSKFLCISEPLLYEQTTNEERIDIRPRANTYVIKTGNRKQGENDTQNSILDKVSTSWPIKCLSHSEMASSSIADIRSTYKCSREDDISLKSNQNGNNKVKTFDYTLLTNGRFILFIAIYSFGNIAIGSAHIYTPTFARDIGIDDQRISIMVSVISLTDFCGRILAGCLADYSWISPTRIALLSQIVVACVLQFTVYFTEFWHMMLFVALYGSTSGMLAALFPPMMLESVGKEKYRQAMAIFVLVIGFVFGVTLPLLGKW